MAQQGEQYPPLPSKPPNKARYDQACQRLQSLITEREEERRRLSAEARKKRETIAILKGERDLLAGERTNIFAQLDKINKEVSKKAESVQKLRAGLPSANADLVDGQIRRLEEQINKGHFKLAEERRLVAETDRLKRSRRTLKEWQGQREELESLRGEQKLARDAREQWFKASKAARMKEEDEWALLREVVERLEAVKAGLEEIREERRYLVAEFRAQEAEWKKEVERKREVARKREEEERRLQAEEKEKEEREEREKAEPFLAERRLVALLQQYCSRLTSPSSPSTPSTTTAPSFLFSSNPISTFPSTLLAVPTGSRRRSSGFSCVSSGSSTYATPLCHTPNNVPSTPTCGSPPDPTGGTFSRKASVAEADVSPALGKRGKREARRRRSSAAQLRKVLAHNPETYGQFQSLGLNPPLTQGGVAETQVKLQEKMEELEHKAAMVKLSRLSVQQEVSIGAEINSISEVNIAPKAPSLTGLSLQLPTAVKQVETLQQTTAPAEMAAINATSYTIADSSAPAISINDLKPETHCDSLDLETGFSTVPAILLSPASNEGIEIEEKVFLKEQYFDNSYHDNDDKKEVGQQLIKIDKSKSEDEISTVGPIIQVTDCDNEKSNSSGLIAASCIIAR